MPTIQEVVAGLNTPYFGPLKEVAMGGVKMGSKRVVLDPKRGLKGVKMGSKMGHFGVQKGIK